MMAIKSLSKGMAQYEVLYIPTDTYIWHIYGETYEELIKLANLFKFD
ncbi:hypothetical protein [Bacillus sp. FJAT-50079]|nr:hypothetical protein [Bacillus sp. FJAT-50079]MBS4206527.1 hypothetical protein [Bacillus sp. FJAT-50079]